MFYLAQSKLTLARHLLLLEFCRIGIPDMILVPLFHHVCLPLLKITTPLLVLGLADIQAWMFCYKVRLFVTRRTDFRVPLWAWTCHVRTRTEWTT